ncbi:MAG: potassium transporter TrkG [Steroidobacteraceae bacterium]|jgi:trk system potassium uptake protein TrkH
MNLLMVQRILGLMLLMFSLSMLPPIGVSMFYADGHWYPFAVGFAVVASIGAALFLPVRKLDGDLRLRDGFLIVALFWVCLSLAGAVPLLVTDVPALSVTDAVFEAVSGFSTTGATVITGLDSLPKSLLYYRQQIQFLGGMSIVVLAVALMPILGIGGMALFKAETPGPVKDQRLTPRIAQTARALWGVYVLLTLLCAAGYWLAGMGPFDAIGHAFTTTSTGGFSPYDASMGHFDSAAIDAVATVFMFLGGASFALHFTVFRHRSLGAYLGDTEFKAYLWLLAIIILLATVYMWLVGTYGNPLESLRYASFQVVSMHTGTGYTTAFYAAWPGALPAVLLLISFISGCAGGTTGGMKIIRWVIVSRQAMVQFRQLVHPSANIPVKVAGRVVPPTIITGVAGFFAVYLITFALFMILLLSFGVDQVTAWSAVAATLNNVGPGLGEVAVTFQGLPDGAKWVCTVAMLAGRLEVFTLFLLLTPAFWQR